MASKPRYFVKRWRADPGGAPIVALGAVFALVGALLVIGSIGPWAKIGLLTISGLEMNPSSDAWLSLCVGVAALGVAAIVASSRRYLHLITVMLIAFAWTTWAAAEKWGTIDGPVEAGTITFDRQAGWGIIMVTIAAAAGVASFVVFQFWNPEREYEPDVSETPADAIAALADLHARGAVTDAEFTAKKRELLERM